MVTQAQALPNIPFPTLGGRQCWMDAHLHHHWRIQQNHFTGHYRLLGAYNIRLAWGSYEHCLTRMQKLAAKNSLEPMKGHVVVLLHGLIHDDVSVQQKELTDPLSSCIT